jgi:virulence-associated protein VagC
MTTTIFMNGRSQAVRLPKEFRLPGERVSVRRLGDGVLLEPVKETSWPEGYFKKILIRDKAFSRPDQGVLPPSPSLDA